MNRWAASNPELYEQLGHDGYVDYFREAADMERKRQKEEGPIKQVSPDRAVLTDDDREMCPACGEFPAIHVGGFCRRCETSVEEDRLNRGE